MKAVLLAIVLSFLAIGCGPIEYSKDGNPCPYLSFGPSSCDNKDETTSVTPKPKPSPAVYIDGKPTKAAGTRG